MASLAYASGFDAARADDKPKSLDEQLLDDLNSDVAPSPVKKPAADKPESPKPSAKKPAASGLDEKLLDEIEGEDIELGPTPNPLTRIGREMRKVETLIDKRDTSAATQARQQQIVRDLSLLLEQTKKQCQGGQCNAQPKSSQSSSNNSKTAAGNKPSEGEPSNKPARDSTDRLAKAGKTEVTTPEEMETLVKRVWGHLPDKVRDQMQNVGVENFLPKYEKLIEEYYKRLAEEESR
jgi:hypothetical protein